LITRSNLAIFLTEKYKEELENWLKFIVEFDAWRNWKDGSDYHEEGGGQQFKFTIRNQIEENEEL